jgi:hypothetical protein
MEEMAIRETVDPNDSPFNLHLSSFALTSLLTTNSWRALSGKVKRRNGIEDFFCMTLKTQNEIESPYKKCFLYDYINILCHEFHIITVGFFRERVRSTISAFYFFSRLF